MARSTPQKHTRKWYLNELCKALYGRVKVTYEKQDDMAYIIEDSGIADKCDFQSPISIIRYKEKMKTLLQYTFLREETIFTIKKKDGTTYTSENVIQNAIDYFKTIEIDITQYEKMGLSTAHLLYFGLSEYVLEAIFRNPTDNDDADPFSENIKESFAQCLSDFKWELVRQVLFRQDTALIENQEYYFDPLHSNMSFFTKQKKFSEQLGDCNYAIPLTLKETFSLPSFDKVSISIPVGPRSAPPLSYEEEFKRLVSGYIPISVEDPTISSNEIFYNSLIVPFHQEQVEYCLSDVSLIDDRKFYFLTKIDKSILETRYDTPKNHEDLHIQILQRAKEQIRKQNSEYKNIEDKWAICILNYIDDVLCRIESLIRYSEYVQGDVPDEQTGINMLNIFGIQYHDLFEKLIEYNDSLEQWNVVYICFDYAINSFTYSLHNQMLTSFLRENTSTRTLEEHKKRTQDIISSTYVESAIKKQEESNKERTNVFSIELTCFSFSRIPNVISLFKKRVENYLSMLKVTPTSTTVSSCPEKKKTNSPMLRRINPKHRSKS